MKTIYGTHYIDSEKDNVILLGDLEFGMPVDQLEDITNMHNNGIRLEEISEKVGRNAYEVLIALLHQVKRGKKIKPLAYRR